MRALFNHHRVIIGIGMVILGGVQAAWAEGQHRCRHYTRDKQAFFGDLHSHSVYSIDAATLDTRNTPYDSFRFAKGQKVGVPPFVDTRYDKSLNPPSNPGAVTDHPYCFPGERCEFTATRTVQLPEGRALDFMAATDHSEQLGETNTCFWEGNVACDSSTPCAQARQTCYQGRCVPKGYDSVSCALAREEVSRLRSGTATTLFAVPYVINESPARLPFCGPNGVDCIFQARNVWQRMVQDAEAAYDRSDECRFTSFVGYEYTPTPSMGYCSVDFTACWDSVDCSAGQTCNASKGGGDNLHRNIIFKDQNVIFEPISNIEAPIGCGNGSSCLTGDNTSPGPIGSPLRMLTELKKQCSAVQGCDVISIPHNSNMSGGAMFRAPQSAEEAAIRREMEPLVEIYQIKGQSECRYSTESPGAWDTFDPLCSFETTSFAHLNGNYIPHPNSSTILPSNYVRNALKSGLQYAACHNGKNPFEFGFVGDTDNHDGTPGSTDPRNYAKNGAHGDESFTEPGSALNETYFLGLEANPGGLTVTWAEENTRESIFAALKRRETYATSGTRPIVRFFGGSNLKKNMCESGNFVQEGYQNGVPMGGNLAHSQQLRFAVLASKDPGTVDQEGTPLQRIQIIKGWVDANGVSHEATYDVAGSANNGSSVDLKTCRESKGSGSDSLCAVWEDPDFHPNQHAFYYARVIENPSCRWSQYYCNSHQVDCSKQPDPSNPSSRYTEWEYRQCCSGYVPSTVQQRASTSPIWYTP